MMVSRSPRFQGPQGLGNLPALPAVMHWTPTLSNLHYPPIPFLALGVLATIVHADLQIPAPIAKGRP